MFSRLLDIAEIRAEKRAARLGKPFKGQFDPKEQELRWSNFKNLPAEQMLKLVRDDTSRLGFTMRSWASALALAPQRLPVPQAPTPAP